MKENKDRKYQVLLSPSDDHKLKNIIINYSSVKGQLMTASAYIREMITNHIKEYEGEQNSFVNERVKDIIQKTKEQQKNEK